MKDSNGSNGITKTDSKLEIKVSDFFEKRISVKNSIIFSQKLRGSIKREDLKGRKVILDFSDVENFDSSAIGSIVNIYQYLSKIDQNPLVLKNLSEKNKELIRILNLHLLFKIV